MFRLIVLLALVPTASAVSCEHSELYDISMGISMQRKQDAFDVSQADHRLVLPCNTASMKMHKVHGTNYTTVFSIDNMEEYTVAHPDVIHFWKISKTSYRLEVHLAEVDLELIKQSLYMICYDLEGIRVNAEAKAETCEKCYFLKTGDIGQTYPYHNEYWLNGNLDLEVVIRVYEADNEKYSDVWMDMLVRSMPYPDINATASLKQKRGKTGVKWWGKRNIAWRTKSLHRNTVTSRRFTENIENSEIAVDIELTLIDANDEKRVEKVFYIADYGRYAIVN